MVFRCAGSRPVDLFAITENCNSVTEFSNSIRENPNMTTGFSNSKPENSAVKKAQNVPLLSVNAFFGKKGLDGPGGIRTHGRHLVRVAS